MSKLNLLLILGLLASCLVLVRTEHQGRQLYNALDQSKREQRRLEAEYRRLDAERQTQATHQKVGRVAAERLQMAAPLPSSTVYVYTPVLAAAHVNQPATQSATQQETTPAAAAANAGSVR